MSPSSSRCIDFCSSARVATRRIHFKSSSNPRSLSTAIVSCSMAKKVAVEVKSTTVGGIGTSSAFAARITES